MVLNKIGKPNLKQYLIDIKQYIEDHPGELGERYMTHSKNVVHMNFVYNPDPLTLYHSATKDGKLPCDQFSLVARTTFKQYTKTS